MRCRLPLTLSPRGQRGFALLAVLWLTALLALLVGINDRDARLSARIARAMTDRLALTEVAEGGLREALVTILADRRPDRLRARRLIARRGPDGSRLVVTVTDEGARVNLNLAAAPVIAAVMLYCGVDERDISAQLQPMLSRGNLAHGFRSVTQALSGMVLAPRARACLMANSTVHGEDQGLNGPSVPRALRGVLESWIARFNSLGTRSVPGNQQTVTLPEADGESRLVRLTAEAVTAEGHSIQRVAILALPERQGDARGFTLLLWGAPET